MQRWLASFAPAASAPAAAAPLRTPIGRICSALSTAAAAPVTPPQRVMEMVVHAPPGGSPPAPERSGAAAAVKAGGGPHGTRGRRLAKAETATGTRTPRCATGSEPCRAASGKCTAASRHAGCDQNWSREPSVGLAEIRPVTADPRAADSAAALGFGAPATAAAARAHGRIVTNPETWVPPVAASVARGADEVTAKAPVARLTAQVRTTGVPSPAGRRISGKEMLTSASCGAISPAEAPGRSVIADPNAASRKPVAGKSARSKTRWSKRKERRRAPSSACTRTSPPPPAEAEAAAGRRASSQRDVGAGAGQKRWRSEGRRTTPHTHARPAAHPPMTAWALVPWNAKALTAVRAGKPTCAAGAPPSWRESFATPAEKPAPGPRTLSASIRSARDTCGFTSRRWESGTATRRPTETRAAIAPRIPAAGSAWPAEALREVRASGAALPPPPPVALLPSSTVSAAVSSIGSPRAVPVPCICSSEMDSGSAPKVDRASLITACWDGPFGAVSELLRPS